MRCHHCGYVSFDSLTVCRRCANPLLPTRQHDAPAPVTALPPVASSVAVQETPVGLLDRFVVEGETVEEELDRSRLTLPAELKRGEERVFAGCSRRAVAALVDAPLSLVLILPAMVLAYVTALLGGTVAREPTLEIKLLALGAALVAGVAVSLAYHVLSWGQGGQTPGKMLMGVRVVTRDGGDIGYGRAFLRWVGYFIALLPFGLGLIMVLIHPRRRGLHDLLAGTSVVRVDAGGGQ
ncbi:MAG: RDD family protein [Candidatus Methylomirabilales bacterium]